MNTLQTTQPLSGRFHLRATPEPTAAAAQRDELASLLDRWIDALRLGMFAPAALLRDDVPFPPGPDPLSFPAQIDPPAGTAPPLLVSLEFATAVPEADRDGTCAALETWAALLLGGYPWDGDPLGASGIGGLEVRFVHPTTVQLSADSWRAHRACFAPLLHLACAWHRQRPLAGLLIE